MISSAAFTIDPEAGEWATFAPLRPSADPYPTVPDETHR